MNKNTKKVYLNDRQTDSSIEFKVLMRLLYHFLNEICLQSKDKPFIICDSTTHSYNLNGVSLKHAFKIGALHSNPFINFNPNNDLNPKINHFQKIHLLDKVVLLSEELKNDLDGKTDLNKLTVIPNFILDEQFEYENIKKDLNEIFIFTRIAPIKRIEHIIRAFKIVSDKKENIILNIYGGTAKEDEVEELIMLKELTKELNIENKVKFKGYAQNVSELMRKNLFTILTSKSEGLPMTLLESMANSSPVISYNFKYGPNDIISNNIDGIIVNNNDIEGLAESMLYLLNNPQIAIKMGEKAKKKIKNNYSMSSAGQKWENLFIDIFIDYEINNYFEEITIKNRYNKLKKEIKIIKKENETLKKQLDTSKNSNEKNSKFKNIIGLFNKN